MHAGPGSCSCGARRRQTGALHREGRTIWDGSARTSAEPWTGVPRALAVTRVSGGSGATSALTDDKGPAGSTDTSIAEGNCRSDVLHVSRQRLKRPKFRHGPKFPRQQGGSGFGGLRGPLGTLGFLPGRTDKKMAGQRVFGGALCSAPMAEINMRQPQQTQVMREVVLRFTGSVEKSELSEGLKVAGTFRRLRWLTAAGALFIALLGVRIDAEGGSVNIGLAAAAVVYAIVFALVVPRRIVAYALRAQKAHEGADCVVDGTGIAAVLDGADIKRLGWDAMTRYHETPSLYVTVGRTGLKSWVMVLPKRLMSTSDAELLGAVLDSRLPRG